MYATLYVCMNLCIIYIYIYICMYVCMYACMYAYMCVSVCVCVCARACVYVYVYVCITSRGRCVYVRICVCITSRCRISELYSLGGQGQPQTPRIEVNLGNLCLDFSSFFIIDLLFEILIRICPLQWMFIERPYILI